MTKLKSAFLAVPVCALVGWVGYSFYQAYQPQPERFQGQIEAQQYNVSSKVPGRIDDVLVRKGQQVEKGDLIFTIYSPELEAKLEQAKAGQQAADAMAEQAERGARSQEINAARDQWQKARAAAQLAEKTYNRVDALYIEGVTAEQKRDEAYTQWQAAKYTENAAHQMYEMAKAGARTETKRAAQEKARMAAGAVAEVEAYTNDTKIHSWNQGEVSQILLHSGELAPQGFPVVTVIDMNDAWAVFNVREDKLRQFQQGTEFDATIPALGEQAYRFKVSHVAPMGDFATWRATNNQKGYDMRTFEVEARPVSTIQGLRAGMSVLVSEANEQG
ncbi:HlyD family secretion protein [Enterovibrio nigricans]|uniref:HlyD family secretion protein n=1 Tax=Enterovibrio nigricans DSM 22720 TaxID=1121868 RepID=A0A1T4VCF8_9GAMM|nr:efflux RND transporter periplasmic adaptor subunit [Enterovibrio nigricans]SKA62617.1 HlyD family secretion protein [Enterovibrio nigricans DSM 22720]